MHQVRHMGRAKFSFKSQQRSIMRQDQVKLCSSHRTSEAWQKAWKGRKSLEAPGSPACQGWHRLESRVEKLVPVLATLEQPGLSGNFPD